ncbi:hypothetical protein FOYG_15046 [Fusarium oxysporum NRRL 32931]|uniref:Uncharacterized protein n=1 Tax=Fusarium oxysporum NRRL 32931 TaxID=660029 RepID=W9HRX9_FUSOX|nr:hypothetical protein FOYG_15046 [Fusarium oxysporum NRRL 32931]
MSEGLDRSIRSDLPAPTRAFFYQNHPNQTDLHNYTDGSVVTPQVATAYRVTLQGRPTYKALEQQYEAVWKSICMEEYDKLNSRFLIPES